MSEDSWFLTIFFGVMISLVIIMTISLMNSDHETWNKQFNGCYERVHSDDSVFHPDKVTRSLYCPRG